MDPVTPLEAGGEMFQRTKTQSYLEARTSARRPLSGATDTDFEDEGSDFEEEYSPKSSFETDDRRRSQSTMSSYDEAPTPSSSQSQRPFEIRFRPVEGPKGPHLFRASQSSSDFTFDYALQMSPLLPKQPPPRTETAFSEETVTPITQQRAEDFSIAAALSQPLFASDDAEERIRSWTTQQVIDFLYSSGLDASAIECFEMHDVNGTVLLDLQFDDLKELDIPSFGKRHQIWNAICDLKSEEPRISPQPTPFEDASRPCTSNSRRSPSRSRNACETPIDGDVTPFELGQGKKRRGRKPKHLDVITPAESVSIVAIEQLLPKPHKCAKGERCAKWRKQQKELQQLHAENGIGRFPISPMKGGRVFVHGDPGNAYTADNMIPNVRKQPEQTLRPEDPFRPTSVGVPSLVASSDLLGPGQLPDFALHASILDQLDRRDPQDNVRQFIDFQHVQSPSPPLDEGPLPSTPGGPSARQDPITRSASVPALFPEQHLQAFPSLHPPSQMPAPHQHLRHLPRLNIPRSSSAASNPSTAIPASASSICRSATASPAQIYRLGTPASEMDVPITAFPIDPTGRSAAQSVPPSMQYRQQHNLSRSQSRAADWRRPSMCLPTIKDGEVFSPIAGPRPSVSSHNSADSKSSLRSSPDKQKVRDPAHHSPETKEFGYGADCSHAGWMKKRKTKLLRHEWQDAHCRLQGTQLGLYENARLAAAAKETINVDDYAVACSSVASSNKLAAAMKAFSIKADMAKKGGNDATAFAFQLVPAAREGEKRHHAVANGKTHHFAVKNKDERIDWMRELMLAKALQQKGRGYEVEVNGVQA
ncbi:hypothetical protein LTR36_002297 [Oleoguttula mirabilis]|uniref:SAM and PH domain-containing protein n=1 Tax=Oleoguttula mirabilis TaxID=1507867 RepID=A0AAV9JKY2_9PEZI|nr:hypothetical protein LTR36_002297 [Oleoguttula mirabilis]